MLTKRLLIARLTGLVLRALLKYFDCRQGLAFKKLQEGAAAGRDIAHLVFDAVFGNGGQCIAPTCDRKTVGIGNRLRHHLRAVGKRSEEHTSELQSLMRISSAVFCLKKNKMLNSHHQ